MRDFFRSFWCSRKRSNEFWWSGVSKVFMFVFVFGLSCHFDVVSSEDCSNETTPNMSIAFGLTAYIKPPSVPEEIRITSYADCKWTLDLSSSRDPFRVWTTYFNERDVYGVEEQLQKPNTTRYLEPVSIGGSDTYYGFPYFILIRGICDDGRYSQQFYHNILQHGIRPIVKLSYIPATSREVYEHAVEVKFTPSLINLSPDDGFRNVPDNTECVEAMKARALDPKIPERICFPAFIVPMVFLSIPMFQVQIDAIGPFREFHHFVYLTPFHSRRQQGVGDIQVAQTFECTQNETRPGGNGSVSVTYISAVVLAKYFFPKERINHTNDNDLDDAALHRLYDSDPEPYALDDSSSIRPIKPAPEDQKPFHPLDSDDFFNPQYTFGTAPSIAIAGFYRPDLIILADPDMTSINLINWSYNEGVNATIFDSTSQLSCSWPTGETNVNGFDKLMYASRGESTYFYRQRFAPMNYTDPNVHAIFEVIALADRFLLLTRGGLIIFYGNSNITISRDRVLRAFENEKLRICFQFIRIAKTALMEYDPIVAVTHTYQTGLPPNGISHDQDIYYGVFNRSGYPIDWTVIGKNEYTDRDVRPPETGSATGHESKQEDLPEKFKICLEVKNNHIDPCFQGPDVKDVLFVWKPDITNPARQLDECRILDASPVPTDPNIVQVMLTMTFTFYKNLDCFENVNCRNYDHERCSAYGLIDNSTCNFDQQLIRLYVIAEHTIKKVILEGSTWQIVGIVPEVPCQGRHIEAVRNILPFGKPYFGLDDGRRSCFEENIERYRDLLILTRMTYTRQITTHMFLYGNRLLHSSDGGQNFILSRAYPHNDTYNDPTIGLTATNENASRIFKAAKFGHRHRIKIMAFSSNSRYAFLTSKRELWVGTMGTHRQLRIRPSPGQSVIQVTSLYAEEHTGIHQGVPFSVFFDSNNVLFELVAIKDSMTGEVSKIVRRPVDYETVLRNAYFVRQLKVVTDKVKKETNGTQPVVVHYEIPDVSLHCSFNRFETKQNYTKTLGRMQKFVTSPPFQHINLGLADIQPTLVAYQVATYRLIHQTFLRKDDNFYSRIEKDPFEIWKINRNSEAFIGYIKYYKEDSNKYGIVVDPRASYRDKDPNDGSNQSLVAYYYFDYGMTVELEFTFYIKAAYLSAKTNFREQTLDHIQINVDNEHPGILRVDVERIEIPKYAAVKFIFLMSLIPNERLVQAPSGRGLVSLPLSFHLVGSFGTCFNLPHWGTIGDSISINGLAGCPPATDILFEWNATLQSLKFRHRDKKYGDPSECYGHEFVCFYAREQIIFHFDVLDMSKQIFVPYTGKYKLRVIGGGHSPEHMVNYTEEEIEAYNIPGYSDISLIWTIALPDDDEVGVESFPIEKDPTTQENILISGLSRIKWACNTLSPCARIAPTWTGRTVYWFKISISNHGIDQGTLCLHERALLIMIYGFPPAPEILLLTTLLSAVLILLTLYLLFYCCRGHKKVWRSQKLKIWGWIQIVTDTFPKPLKNRAILDEKEQLRKDSILLSLQGHLRVPSILHKPRQQRNVSSGGIYLSEKSSGGDSGKSSDGGSAASLESQFSSEVLPQIHPRKAAATWTEMVYEQIISRRLLAIVERNKRMREAILRKVQQKTEKEELEKRIEEDRERNQ